MMPSMNRLISINSPTGILEEMSRWKTAGCCVEDGVKDGKNETHFGSIGTEKCEMSGSSLDWIYVVHAFWTGTYSQTIQENFIKYRNLLM